MSGAYVFCLHTPVYMQSLYIYIYLCEIYCVKNSRQQSVLSAVAVHAHFCICWHMAQGLLEPKRCMQCFA